MSLPTINVDYSGGRFAGGCYCFNQARGMMCVLANMMIEPMDRNIAFKHDQYYPKKLLKKCSEPAICGSPCSEYYIPTKEEMDEWVRKWHIKGLGSDYIEMDTQRETNKQLQQELLDLQSDINSHEETNESLEQELILQDDKLSELQFDIQAQRETNKQLRQELLMQDEKLSEQQSIIDKQAKKIDSISNLNKRLVDTLILYKNNYEIVSYDYQDIRNRNATLNREFKKIAKFLKSSK